MDVDHEGFDRRTSVRLSRDVANESADPEADPVMVTSADLTVDWEDGSHCPFEVAHFSHPADQARAPAAARFCPLIRPMAAAVGTSPERRDQRQGGWSQEGPVPSFN